MSKPNLSSLDMRRFMEISPLRQAAISGASEAVPEVSYPANILANKLHPKKQHLRVDRVTVHSEDTKSFILVPDKAKGTDFIAYFAAGQYVTVYLNINGLMITRPYSLSSSPEEALEGFCRLTVKAVNGGLASQYILDTWKEGTSVTVSEPQGNFTYEPLRDCRHVIGVAGGSGITPFMSLAKAIKDGDEDFTLTLLYGAKRYDDLIFKAELDELAKKCNSINVIYVLSEENKDGFIHGNVTAELIENCSECNEYSLFVCGSKGLYSHMKKECKKLNTDRKHLRFECFGEIMSLKELDCDKGLPHWVNITVNSGCRTHTFTASTDKTLLRSLEENGITPPSSCRSGECGFCNSYLAKGKVYVPKGKDFRRSADVLYNHIHPCCSFPLSDIEIHISEL